MKVLICISGKKKEKKNIYRTTQQSEDDPLQPLATLTIIFDTTPKANKIVKLHTKAPNGYDEL